MEFEKRRMYTPYELKPWEVIKFSIVLIICLGFLVTFNFAFNKETRDLAPVEYYPVIADKLL
ncbi:hypothetical protein M3202_19675 [Alkalihalobacillus oceani]|uniref:Uncharacterized protein n=1 Tax=Halalkalibacter oceani TaxID=1653776 RepID=A0A9X2DTQ4_9BACI|nr:hypothetical protein [Halalkalibacter oceani]MCM3716267.1 hypothetical protein [Halalkalibacter oceani]